jgi:dipeptidyl aminopeptidase/acylaminoacyl peptidase
MITPPFLSRARLACATLALGLTMAAGVRAGDAANSAAGLATGQAPPPTLDVLGSLPSLEQVSVSPAGTRIAYITTSGDTRILAVSSLVEKDRPYALRLGEAKVRSVEWVDDDWLLIVTSVTARVWDLLSGRREWGMGQVCSVSLHRCLPLAPVGREYEQVMNVVVGRPCVRKVGDRALVFATGFYFPDEKGQLVLFSLDPARNRTTVVVRGSPDAQDWIVDEAGRVAAELDYRDRTGTWAIKVRDPADGRLVEVGHDLAFSQLETPALLGLSADGSSVLVRSFAGGTVEDAAVSFADRTWTPFRAPLEASEPVFERLTGRIVGFGSPRAARYSFTDPAVQHRWDSTSTALKGARLRLVSYSDDFQRIVLRSDRFDDGLVYRLLDWPTRRVDPVGNVYEGLGEYSQRRPYAYPAADGMEIPGYLTLPRGREPKALPLVVLPHGGPAAADDEDFDWWSEALASRGYAVLQPNFRGSTLTGQHMTAGFGQWGRKMQTDLSDGVRALARGGTIDPARVCIVGASYGGYAALAGITLDAGVYRCAVAVAGISDPALFLRWVDFEKGRGDARTMHWWLRFVGAKGAADPQLEEISPLAHVDAVSVPVLLIHGRDDTVVPIEQSERIADALRARKKPVEFVELKHEDHWLSRSETRLQMLRTTVDFLERNNPPQ